MKLRSSIFALAAVGCAAHAFGNIYQVNVRASLPFHLDPLAFPPYEQVFPSQPSWGTTIDAHQVFARMDNARDVWYLAQASSTGEYGTWGGNFGHDQRLAFVNDPTPPVTFFFASPAAQGVGGILRVNVSGFGTQIQTQTPGPFVAEIRAYNATAAAWSPWFTVTGNSTAAGDNSAVFLGIGSSDRNISSVQVRARAAANNVAWGWWAINPPNISIAPSPTPGTASAP